MNPSVKNWIELFACGVFALISAWTFVSNLQTQEWLWVILGLIATPYWSAEFAKRWTRV